MTERRGSIDHGTVFVRKGTHGYGRVKKYTSNLAPPNAPSERR